MKMSKTVGDCQNTVQNNWVIMTASHNPAWFFENIVSKISGSQLFWKIFHFKITMYTVLSPHYLKESCLAYYPGCELVYWYIEISLYQK